MLLEKGIEGRMVEEDDNRGGADDDGLVAAASTPRHIKKRAFRNKALSVPFSDKDLKYAPFLSLTFSFLCNSVYFTYVHKKVGLGILILSLFSKYHKMISLL